MTGMEIVREETRRLARGMVPLLLTAFGALTLAGCEPVRTGLSLLLGACCPVLLFRMAGRSAVKAALSPPAQGTRILRRGYIFRYGMTGVFIIAAIKVPPIQPLAAILPLFFPKPLLVLRAAAHRKEANR